MDSTTSNKKKKLYTLTLESFLPVRDGYFTYFSYKDKEIEVCLEPCLNGFDIAIYDLNQNLVRPKVCLNLDATRAEAEAIIKALLKANELYSEYYKSIKGGM